MTSVFRAIGATTALTTLFVSVPSLSSAQIVTVPGCNPAADPLTIEEIGLEAFEDAGVDPLNIVQLLADNELCVLPNGKLKLGAPEAAAVAPAAEPAGGDQPAEGDTPAAGDAPATGNVTVEAPAAEVEAETAEALAEEAPAEEASTVEAPAAEVEAEVEAETAEALADQAPAAESEVEAEAAATVEVETGETSAAVEAETTGNAAPTTEEAIREELERVQEDRAAEADDLQEEVLEELEELAETMTATGTVQPTAEVPSEADASGRPVTVAATDEPGEGEVMETTETTVTEEEARSSDEDFATTAAGRDGTRAPATEERRGLSNFEKFALTAAGIVVLDQVLNDRAEVVRNTGDRVVVRRGDGDLVILKDDDVLLRRPGSEVKTETFSDGSTRTTVTRPNGVKVVTISAADGRVLRRTKIFPDGEEVLLFDDTQGAEPVDVAQLPVYTPGRQTFDYTDRSALLTALEAERYADLDRRFTLAQVRNIVQVRELMPEIVIDAINFETGSAAIEPEEARDLLDLGEAMLRAIEENPRELFLIEGHTDAVGERSLNLALSDRRAESVALALTEYFDVPPENMIVQGYGEEYLLVPTDGPERRNRRATVRRITPLLTAGLN